MDQASGWTPEEVRWDAPVFVSSASRSGSTLLRHLLNSHPELAISRESYLTDYLKLCHAMAGVERGDRLEHPHFNFEGVLGGEHRAIVQKLFLTHSLKLVEEFYLESFPGKPFRRWGDQFHSTLAIPDIVAQWPNVQFIHLVRDGRDRCVSAMRYRAQQREKQAFVATTTVESESMYWERLNRYLFETVDGERGLLVHYEDLVREPRPTLDRIAAFLQIEVAQQMLDYLDEQAKGFHGKHGTSASPEASIGRWRDELSPEDQAVANRIMGPLLQQFGYDPD